MSRMRVAFVQGRPRFGRPAENLERGLALAETVEADLVVLPELWTSGYLFATRAEVARAAEPATGGATARALAATARRRRCHFICGFAEVAAGRFYNSAMLVGPAGTLGLYRKLHLYDREHRWFTAGNLTPAVHRVGPGRVGMLICYDWRFPELARALALLGADVLAHPANLLSPLAPDGVRVRAIENRVFVVTANRTGREARGGARAAFTGASRIQDPLGRLLAAAPPRGEAAQAAVCDLAVARDKRVGGGAHLFRDRRPEFYALLAAARPGSPVAAARRRRAPARPGRGTRAGNGARRAHG